jgi:isopenicillin N synthase-like dioxygenase
LFRQPVAALQILNSEGEWKWVKPQDETITINICDALQALTGGFFKSSVHRVHSPPQDQAHVDRLGVLFFARYVMTSFKNLVTSSAPNNAGSQTQQPRRSRPDLEQSTAEPAWSEGERFDQAGPASYDGAVGHGASGPATASH